MYFWTNTPDQIAFIATCADVNRLNAYINDPNVPEEQAQGYQSEFVAAKNQQSEQFIELNYSWEDWLIVQQFGPPQMRKNGIIDIPSYDQQKILLSLPVLEHATAASGQVYYWEDFFRMMSLRSFLLRSAFEAGKTSYNPESYFHD